MRLGINPFLAVVLALVVLVAITPQTARIEATTIVAPKALITITPDPPSISPGDTATITVKIEALEYINTSTLTIYINGDTFSSVSLSPLANGSTFTYQFNFTPTEPGYYVIQAKLDEVSG